MDVTGNIHFIFNSVDCHDPLQLWAKVKMSLYIFPLEKFISDPAIQSPKSTYILSPTISLCMCLTDLHTTFSQSIESK